MLAMPYTNHSNNIFGDYDELAAKVGNQLTKTTLVKC